MEYCQVSGGDLQVATTKSFFSKMALLVTHSDVMDDSR